MIAIVRRVVAACVAVLMLASACSAAPAETGETPSFFVEMSDYKLVLDHATVTGPHIVIGIRNHAAMVHELKVIKTDVAADQLPIDGAAAKAKEDGKVGELLNIPGGASRRLVAELPAGRYVLICNVAGHYQLGMRVALEVN